MKTFYFNIPTTGYEGAQVEATTLEEACAKIASGEYDTDKSEYTTEDWDTPFRCNLEDWVKDNCCNPEGGD